MRRLLALHLALTMLLSVGVLQSFVAPAAPAVYADEPAADSDYDGIPDALDVAPNSNTFTGKMHSGHDGTTTVSFSMDYRSFFTDPTVYHPDLASVSVLGSALAYYTPSYGEAWFTYDTAQTWAGGTASKVDGVQLLQVLGFEDVVDFSLDSVYSDDDLCEVLIGHRTAVYNGQTKVIVSLWVRGTDSDSIQEWSSNFNVGDLARFFDQYDAASGKTPRPSNEDWTRKTNHRGFDVSATRILKYLVGYHAAYVQPVLDSLEGEELVYWTAGHSRGAAVANLIASYLIDDGFSVFSYTFAAPYNTANTEASSAKYDSIFNLVNRDDFVPMLPMPEWGFTRYGRTATLAASDYASDVEAATGEDYSGKYLTTSDMSTLLGKFICITGENADRDNPGKILGWREVYVYHCGHNHADETNGNYQSTTVKGTGFLSGVSESSWNGYAERLRKYSYYQDGICETPAYCLQVLVELLVQIAQGNTLGGGWNYLTSNKLADKFDFNKQSLISYASKLTEPHFMDTYSVLQTKVAANSDPGALFATLPYYADNGRPAHTHTYTYVPYDGEEPTCTADGLGCRYCTCSAVNADYYDDYQKNVVIPATGHDWGEPTYEWSADCSAVTASAVCANDASHTVTETVSTTYAVTVEPTPTAEGEGDYTAVFETEPFTTQTRTVVLPVTAHTHTPGEPVIENEVPATCTAAGSYDSVVYCSECGEEISRETVGIPALGHNWSAWTSNNDGTHSRTCSVCNETETHDCEFGDDDVCDVCGYERSTEMDLFIGMTLSLEGATSVNYLVPKAALDAYGLDSFKMVVVHTDYDRDTGVYSEETRELAAEAELYVAGGANYYKFVYAEIPAMKLNDVMIAHVEGEKDGVTFRT